MVEQFVEFVGNHYILSIIWLILFFTLVFGQLKAMASPIKSLSAQLVTQRINREDGVVVDIRPKAEFDKGHIAGAVNLPLEKIQKNDLGKLEKRKSNPIIVVCNAGLSASGAATTLFKAGFTDVCILQGGMNTWLGASLPVAKK